MSTIRKRHAVLTRAFRFAIDSYGMLRLSQSLRGSFAARRALGRAIAIFVTSIAISVAVPNDIETAKADIEQPFHIDNIKLYLYNQLDWEQFECANQLAIRESNWRVKAVNKESGAYGIFQHMSSYAHTWDAYEQIDKHIEYIEARYGGSWCAALNHSLRFQWH